MTDTNDTKTDDKEKESFVIMLDDDEPTQQPVKEERAKDSFVILFDDDDSGDQEPAIVSEDPKGEFQVVLGETLTIKQVLALHDTLLKTIDCNKITIDATGVGLIDTAAIQVIASYQYTLDESNIPTEWIGMSEPYTELSQLLDLADAA